MPENNQPINRRPRREIDASQLPIGQPSDIILNDGSIAVGQNLVEPITKDALNKEYQEELAFMDEMLDIMLHESTDKNAEDPVPVGCNGVFVYIKRGQPTRVKRKFVNHLIAKNTRVSTPEYTNAAGERAFKIVQQQGLKYPFSILKDPSHKGGEWLARRMAEVV